MKEETLLTNDMDINQKHLTFDTLWEVDIDSLYDEYGFNSDVDEDEDSFNDENWLIF